MHIEGEGLETGTMLRAPVCIVGAGAAGIALALELAGRGVASVLLESGGFEADAATQALYSGRESGQFREPDYLRTSRLRFFGGTTNHWAGNCRPLDPIDFEARPAAGLPGWPVSAEDMAPFYERAAPWLEIKAVGPESPPPGELAPHLLEWAPEARLHNQAFQSSPPTRFGRLYREAVVEHRDIRLLTHANLLELVPAVDGERIARARVRVGPQREVAVVADDFVLATGAIENARLLLLSRSRSERGIGNQYDLVGRYFSDHARYKKVCTLACWARDGALEAYLNRGGRGSVFGGDFGVLSPSASWLRKAGLPNCAFLLRRGDSLPLHDDVVSAAGGTDAARFGRRAAPGPDVTVRSASGSVANPSSVTFEVIFEIRPSARNRVSLDEERDAHGQPRVHLHWAPSGDDLSAIRRLTRGVAGAFVAAGLGRVALPSELEPEKVRINHHHMGTTRMAASPREGVVDASSRVHGVANLFVAGSSVFPSYGFANPTYTLLALTLRLSDALVARQGKLPVARGAA